MKENRRILLAKGIANGGRVDVGMAEALYSSSDGAKSALQALRAKGFVEATDVPGRFRICEHPPDGWPDEVLEMARTMKRKQDGETA